MHKTLRRRKRDNDRHEKGQAMVEFALCLPFLVLILCLIIDFGWIFSCKNDLTNLAGQAARYGAIKASGPDASTEVENFVKNNGYNAKGKVDIVSVSIDTDTVTVKLKENVNFLTGLTGIFFGGGTDVTLTAQGASPVDPYQ